MNFPYISENGKAEQQIIGFPGLDYRVGAQAGTFAGTKNLSSSMYPGIYQRKGRGIYGEYDAPTAIFAREKLCVVDGTDFLYDGERVGTVSPGEKQMAVVNTKLVIFPDKMYFDLENKEFKTLEAAVTTLPNTAVFGDGTLKLTPSPAMDEIAGRYGRNYSAPYRVYCRYYDAVSWNGSGWEKTNQHDVDVSAVIPSNPDVPDEGSIIGKYMIPGKTESGGYTVPLYFSDDLGPDPENQDGVYGIVTHTLYEQLSSSERWTIEIQLYDGSQKNQTLNLVFKVGDGVTVSGCSGVLAGNNKTAVIRELTEDTITFDSNIFTPGTEPNAVTVKREVPAFEFICESENRLWGVKGTVIYGSALGDPGNFNVFDGLSTDAYSVAVGSEGPFTGCIGYSNGVLFWKERKLHRLVGSSPKDYQIYSYTIAGLQKGCHKSMQIINETLFYKSDTGVYAYQGGTPSLVSAVFSDRRFSDASAGTDAERYYISMKGEDGVWGLYVLDVKNGVWLMEDETEAHFFALVDGKVHFLSGNTVYICGAQAFDGEWYAHFNPINETLMQKKGYGRIYLRLRMAKDAWVKVERRNGAAPWEQVWVSPDSHRSVVEIPILPYFTDALDIQIFGRGNCLIESMVREFDTEG